MFLNLLMFNQKHVNHILSVQQYFSSVMHLIHCHIFLLLSEKGKMGVDNYLVLLNLDFPGQSLQANGMERITTI